MMHDKETMMAALQKLMDVLHSLPDKEQEMGETPSEEASESPMEQKMEDAMGLEPKGHKEMMKVSMKVNPMDKEDKKDGGMDEDEEMKKMKKSPNYMGKL